MKNIFHLLVVSLILLLCIGCMSQAPYKYAWSEKLSTGVSPLSCTISVQALEDQREQLNTDHTLLGWIPLVPYATSQFARPEVSPKFAFKGLRPSQDFARALFDELKQNNLFQETILLQHSNTPSSGLVMTGRIKKAGIATTITFYGMSIFGELPWLIGLPMGKLSNTLDLHYELRRVSDKALLWEHDVQGTSSMLLGAYYNLHDDAPYTGMNSILRTGLREGMLKLQDAIKDKKIICGQ